MSLYLVAVGLLFSLVPDQLSSPVYDAWKEWGLLRWGMMLIATGALHAGALRLNGRAPALSGTVRAIACSLHIYLAIQFAIFFIEGHAVWGTLTMLLLIIQVVPVFWRVMDETRGY